MELTEKSILVPVDFTENSEFAFQHAMQMSKYMHRGIALLHIIKKDHEKPAVLEKLNDFGRKMFEKYGVETVSIVRKGDIFKAINTVNNNFPKIQKLRKILLKK